MGWIGTRLLKKPPPEDIEPEVVEEEAPSGPPLVLLVPDAAAVSSFRCYSFNDAAATVAFIESAVPSEARPGLHAFWASHEQPETAHDAGEATVLIRTSEDSNLMYVVSFVDIASAQSFARFEVKRGLNLGLVTIYWADMIEVRETGNGLTLTPSTPPVALAARDSATVTAPPAEIEPAAEASEQEPADVIEEPVALAEADEDPELRLLLEEPALIEEAAPVDVADASAQEPETPEAEAIAGSSGAAVHAEPIGELPCLTELDSTVLSFRGDEEEDLPERPGMYAVDPPIETVAGDEELACDVWTLPAADAPQADAVDAGEGEPQPDEDAVAADLTAEIDKILKNRRWEKRDDPFKGFGSPPGRF